ncbi:hypothetical protein R6Q57_023417 [Mikania cordata]
MEKVNEDGSLDFMWLKKKGFGGKNKEVKFYESFIYDGVEYMLYDCVYMYKEGLPQPYIGKLTKIWERPDKSKKVKVHWFFRPEEISKWLGETKTLENEIFFASGGGHGLANVNPLVIIILNVIFPSIHVLQVLFVVSICKIYAIEGKYLDLKYLSRHHHNRHRCDHDSTLESPSTAIADGTFGIVD